MRELAWPDYFDLALSIFTSFGYFEDPKDDLEAARSLCRALKPGGVLVMELVGKEVLARMFSDRDCQRLADGRLWVEERRVVNNWSWVQSRWALVPEGDSEGVPEEFQVEHRIYSAVELSALLREAGFGRVDIYGHLEGVPYDQDARRLVAVARRQP